MVLSDTAICLGSAVDVATTGTPPGLSTTYRCQGMTVLGLPGMGKTEFLKSLIRQDIANRTTLVAIDAHGDLTDDVLALTPDERIDDVTLLDASDPDYAFGINIFACADRDDPVVRQAASDRVIGLFKRVFAEGENPSWGARLEDVLYNQAEVFLDNPGLTLAETLAFLRDPAFRAGLLAQVAQADVRAFWEGYGRMTPAAQANLTGSTTNKLRRFTTHRLVRHIVGQTSTIDLRRLIDTPGAIVLIKLPAGVIGDEAVALLGTFLLSECLRAVLSRADTRERPMVALYADECHRFTGEDFVLLLEEARKYGVAPVLATQRLDKLGPARPAALGAANLVLFQLMPGDARAVVDRLRPTPEPGPPVRQRAMRRHYDGWDEEVWEPAEAASEHAAVSDACRRLAAELALLADGGPADFHPVSPARPAVARDVISAAFTEWGVDGRFTLGWLPTLAIEERLGRARRTHPDIVATLLATLEPELTQVKRRAAVRYQPSSPSLRLGAAATGSVPVHRDARAPELVIAARLAARRSALEQQLAQLEARLAELWACRRVERRQTDTGYDEPISRFDSGLGRLVPVYEWVPGPIQSPSAARDALVEQLVNLPPYRALVRIRAGEHEYWQGFVAPALLDRRDADETKLARIRQRSREDYYRRRVQVEEEIRARERGVAASVERPAHDPARVAMDRPTGLRGGPIRRREVVE